MKAMEIGGRKIGPGQPVLVIAEIGNNHNGEIEQARRLVEAAAEAGADVAKFQTHIADAELLPSTPTPPHFDEPRFEFTKRMELSYEQHAELKALTEQHGMLFLSSPFSVEAVELLERLGVAGYKVASGEVTNPPLLEAIAATGKPALVSSGLSGLDEVEAALAILRGGGCEVCVMQCTSSYPCPPEQVNLRAMATLAERFDCPVGLSDHTPDTNTAIAAVALGAACIEKHFTLDRTLYGPDHHASLEPDDLARLVRGVREVEAALGDGRKERDPDLDPVRASFEKSVVVREPITAGAELTAALLTTKRPGTGIPATRIGEVVGRRAARDIAPDRLLEEADLG